MGAVLLRALSFALMILAGILFRRFGIVPDDAGQAAKKITLCFTLPAAIITNFANIETLDVSMLLLTVIGLAMNVIMIAVGILTCGRNADGPEKALHIMTYPGLNIGAFSLPFVQSFLPPIGSVAACMLDVGNSIMCTGVTYAFAAEYTKSGGSRFSLRSFLKRLVSSVPLDTYVIMFTLTLLNIRLPDFAVTLIQPAAQANTFMAMFMLGLLFHLEIRREYLLKVGKILFFRNACACVFAFLLYRFLPFDLVIRQACVILCFSPLSAVSPAFTGMCGGDEGMASCANSLSILLSLAVMTALITGMGLAG